jgi:hypothetical protein
MTNQREMESTRITVARALELGVRLSWREATAIVQEAIARAAPTEGVGPARVTIDDCVLTRGGDVMLTGTAAWARPEAVVPLLDDLLARCSDPGRFAGAVANGTALEMIEELSQHISPKRRRVEVASVALRGLAAAADAARARADAEEHDRSADLDDFIAAPTPATRVRAAAEERHRSAELDDFIVAPTPAARARTDAEERHRSADLDDFITAPTPATSPTARPRPWPMVQDQRSALRGDGAFGNTEARGAGFDDEDLLVAAAAGRERTARQHAVAARAIGASPASFTRARPTLTQRPASFSIDAPRAKPQVTAVSTDGDVWGGGRSRVDWVKRASPVALVCLLVAAAWGVVRQMPVTQQLAVEPSGLAVEPNEPAVAPSEPVVQPSDPAIERSEPAVEPPAIEASFAPDGHTPVARQEPAPLPEAADPPAVPPVPTRSTPRGSPGIEGRSAPTTAAQDSIVRPISPPAGGRETPVETTTTIAASPPRSSPSAAAAVLPPGPASLASAPPPAVAPSSVVASPSATAASPVEPSVSAPTAVPANAAGRSAEGLQVETRAIENVLGRYRIAFNNLDAGAASAVWPTVNEKTLAKAFERLESHDVSFESCQIEILYDAAEAACSGRARYVPKVGSRTPKDEARRWKFSLRKANGGWLIDRVDAR